MIIASILGLMYVGLSMIPGNQENLTLCPILRYSERNDGKVWFSWIKKLSKSPALDWLAIYRLENNRQSAFTNFIFSFPFEDFDATLEINSGSLFIFMWSYNDFGFFTSR